MSEPTSFERKFFTCDHPITRIGTGSLGGKADGLNAVAKVIADRFGDGGFDGLTVTIPQATVVATDHFDRFMQQNDLFEMAYGDHADDRIAAAFQRADLPLGLAGDLRALADEIRTPLAIRSSSLLEDALRHPFAGVYATKMIPNNQPSADRRFKKLVEAIKFVWASTFFKGAKRYLQTIEQDIDSEKMAVILQEVVGQRHGDRFYPTVSGVARSFNYYPFGHARADDGVVSLALGLGKTIVDGGRAWSYCPLFPKSPPPFNSTRDLLHSTQTRFWAVNMGRPPDHDPIRETEYLVHPGLLEAEYDNTLRFAASTYTPRSNRIVPGVGQDGPRVIDFAPILSLSEKPLNGAVAELLAACEETLNTDVEIEFAATFDQQGKAPDRLGFLQVRPMMVSDRTVQLSVDQFDDRDVLVATDQALGNGRREDIDDIIYICPQEFEMKHSQQVAVELERLNSELGRARRPYVLIGFGRWGSSDPWRGIPVSWDQISWARGIVEAEYPGVRTEMSQGSHFFHNLSSFGVSYFSLPLGQQHEVDFKWLREQREISRTRFLRHVRTPSPMAIIVDGRSGRGVILHHDR